MVGGAWWCLKFSCQLIIVAFHAPVMRVVSINLNGIRSAANKGFYAWLEQQAADVVCMQEVKAQAADLTAAMSAPPGWHAGFHFAEKKGYSGVGIYSRRAPDRIQTGFGSPEFDAEGRYVEMRFGALSVVSVYFPSGASAPERQQAKFRFLDLFFPHLETLKADGQEVFVVSRWPYHSLVSEHATREEAQRMCDLANHELYEKASPHQRKIAEAVNKLDQLFGRN